MATKRVIKKATKGVGPRRPARRALGRLRKTQAERSERSKDRIASAWLELIREGDVNPPVEKVAERAGVSRRLVFHHFRDKEQIQRIASLKLREKAQPLLSGLLFEGTFEERLETFVAKRAALYEFITPTRRAARYGAPRSKLLDRGLQDFRATKRREMSQVFAPELERLGRDERALVEPELQALGSWAHWESLRHHQGLSIARSRAVLHSAITRLLLGRAK